MISINISGMKEFPLLLFSIIIDTFTLNVTYDKKTHWNKNSLIVECFYV